MKAIHLVLSILCISSACFAGEKIYSTQGFVRNEGQIRNQYNEVNNDARYIFNQNGMNIILRNNGFSYDCYNTKNPISFHRVEINFIGCNKNAKHTMLNPSEATLNYITDANTVIQTQFSDKILLEGVYPGIDVLFKSNARNGFEYDFIIHPGADLSNIRLHYKGAQKSHLNKDNRIVIETSLGNITEEVPRCYLQENNQTVDITCKKIEQDIFGFETLSDYTNSTLVIDPIPSRDWGTYFGGNSNERGEDLSYDQMGNIYLGGYTSSASNIATSGSHQINYAGNTDAFIAKFDTSGSLVWASYFGGIENETGLSVCANSNNLAWLSGYTNSTNGIATPGSHQSTYGGGLNDAFLACFNGTDGTLSYATYFGGSDDDKAFGLDCDNLNRLYLVGHAASADNIASAGAFQDSTWGLDAFVAVFDGNTGARQWSTYFGGEFYESFTDVSIDADYNIYCSGRTFSTTNIATPGAHQTTYSGINFADVALVKFDSSGTRIWSTYFGGSDHDYALGVRAANGYVYISGQTFSTNNVATFSAYQPTYGGNGDGYYARFLDSGLLTYASYYGDTAIQSFEDIVVDQSGRTFVCGSTNSPAGGTHGTHQSTYGGQIDGSLSCFDSFGSPAWTTYYGGNFYDDLKSIALVDNTMIFSVGTTTSFNNIATPGVYQSSKMGVDDAYMVKFSSLLPTIGIDEFESLPVAKAFPNPISNGQRMQLDIPIALNSTLTFYSLTGKHIFDLRINSNQIEIPFGIVSKGEYHYLIHNNGRTIASGKIIIQ